MGRKSLAEERREEILSAFERCIARYGLDVPLERIAAEAGVQRSLIRHYLGNRDEVVTKVITRIATKLPEQIAAGLNRAAEDGVDGLLYYLFDEPYSYDDHDTILLAVIGSAQGRYPQAKQQIVQMTEQIVAHFAATLTHLLPDAPPERCAETAYGLFGLFQTNDLLIWLGMDSGYTRHARASAYRLLAQL